MASKLDQHRDQIIERLRDGAHLGQLARELQVARSTLRDYLDRHNLRVEAAVDPSRIPQHGTISTEELQAEEIRQLRRALSKQRRGDVSTERIVAAVEQALADVEHPVTFTAPSPSEPSRTAHHRHVAVWSDWHGGENVDPETVNGLNDYDWQIMESRVDEMLDAMLSHKRRSPELTGLDILIPGDQCSGSNHRELAVTNEYPLAEQGVRMGYLQGRAIEHLAPHYEDIRVVTCVGNHPRLVVKPAAKDTHDNMDWVSYVIASEYLRRVPNVSAFTIGRTSVIHEVAGRQLYLFHGDGIRSSMPGVPWGGVMRRVNEIARMTPTPIDHFVLGHFHSPNVVQGGRIIMNGSLKGVDEWVMKNFGGGERPTQLLLSFDERHGRLTETRYLTPTTGL